MIRSTADTALSNSDGQSRSRQAVTIAGVTLLYWLAMFLGTHLPLRQMPFMSFRSADKVQHFTAYAGLAALLCLIIARRGISTRRLLMTVMMVVAIYGILDETTQAFVPGREPDVLDWLADMVGSGLGIGVFVGIRALCRRMGSRATS